MRTSFGWVFVGLMACTNAGTVQDPGGPPPDPTPVTAPETPPASTSPASTPPASTPPATTPAPATPAAVTVQMTAATLGDDCGGPPPAGKAKQKSVAYRKQDMACDQSSMQLSVVAAAGAPTQLTVKKVELLDDKGAMIGELTTRTPTVWDPNGTYQPWDQSIAPGQELSVSYALSEPPWASVSDRRNRGYVLKAVLTIGGGEQSVQRDVRVSAPTILPPGVKT